MIYHPESPSAVKDLTLPAAGSAASRALSVVSPLWGLCPSTEEICLTQGHDTFPGLLYPMTDQCWDTKAGQHRRVILISEIPVELVSDLVDIVSQLTSPSAQSCFLFPLLQVVIPRGSIINLLTSNFNSRVCLLGNPASAN